MWLQLAVILLGAAATVGGPAAAQTFTGWNAYSGVAAGHRYCGVTYHVNGGDFSLFTGEANAGELVLLLQKPSWRMYPGMSVPLVMRFADGTVFRMQASGSGTRMRFSFPAEDLRGFIHHFTADGFATLAFPAGAETPWPIALVGTTADMNQMTACMKAANLVLPPPFSPPYTLAEAQAVQAPPVGFSGPDTAGVAAAGAGQAARVSAGAPAGLPGDVPAPGVAAASVPAQPAVSHVAPPVASVAPAIERRPPRNDSLPGWVTAVAAGLDGLFLCLFLAGAAVYFVPYIIGRSRRVENRFWLLLANIFLGWTGFGWFACLAWATLAQDGVRRAIYQRMLRGGR